MSPDPSYQSEERHLASDSSNSNVNTENNDSNISYEGYEVLPQDFSESNIESEDLEPQESNSDDDSAQENAPVSTTFDQAMKIELTELWNSSESGRISDIIIDSTKEEQIKNAMAGFHLPSSSIPLWAKNIPEEQWKQQILNKIATNEI